jgi:hypothetical protein
MGFWQQKNLEILTFTKFFYHGLVWGEDKARKNKTFQAYYLSVIAGR